MTDGDCVFCAIAARDVHGRVVHETDHSLAFLDANPLAPGHTVAVPKDHYPRVGDLPDRQAEDLFAAVHGLAGRVRRAVDADALSVGVNDGAAAGQQVEHVHVHLVPRFDGDGGGPVHAAFPDHQRVPDAEMDEIATVIRESMQ
jgi:histidine triad (HIT) family protein